MGQAYSNNGLSYRTSPGGADLRPGEVYFAEPPTTARLQTAFPSYTAALQALERPDIAQAVSGASFQDVMGRADAMAKTDPYGAVKMILQAKGIIP